MCSRSFQNTTWKVIWWLFSSNLEKAQYYFIWCKRILKIHLRSDYRNEIVITWSLDQPGKPKYKLFKHMLENVNLSLQNYMVIPHFFLRNADYFFLLCLVCSFGPFWFTMLCGNQVLVYNWYCFVKMMVGQMRDVVLSARKLLTMIFYDITEERLLYWYWVSQESNPCCMPRNCLKILIPADSLENVLIGFLVTTYK